MLSTSNTQREEEKRQERIRRQIAELQAQLPKDSEVHAPVLAVPNSPERRKRDVTVLAPATPSPKKRKLAPTKSIVGSLSTSNRTSVPALPVSKSKTSAQKDYVAPAKPAASALVSKLASLSKTTSVTPELSRSSGFTESAKPPVPDAERAILAPTRDERLALIEEVPLGPIEHNPPSDDPTFAHLEPNSGIRLSEREVPHEDLQEHLRGRYILSPSQLYATARISQDKQSYDIPLYGDFVTIAVVAERGPIRHSRAPVAVSREDGGDDDNARGGSDDEYADVSKGGSKVWQVPAPKKDGDNKGKGKEQAGPPKKSGKKFVNLKLVDFGARASSSASGGKSIIRGDAQLALLLFESDACETRENDEGKKVKVYRGGSRGAFENMSRLREGAVIAILNPRILKPFQRSNDTPNPQTNLLALTPESLDSVMVIGHCRDLGMCTAIKKDGKSCGAWCDKRVADVCDYHVQRAVQSARASRPEFARGTGGMTSGPPRRKAEYDPAKQWGLKPANGATSLDAEGGATYVVQGHIVSGKASSSNLFVAESMGREGQAKAARRAAIKESEKALQKIASRDREGMRAVVRAREVGLGKDKLAKAKAKTKETMDEATVAPRKNAYSAAIVKEIGFDPTAIKTGGRRIAEHEVQSKLDALSALQSVRSEVQLGPRPGKKATTVAVPEYARRIPPSSEASSQGLDDLSENSDDDLERAEVDAFGYALSRGSGVSRAQPPVSLESDDEGSELEVEPPL